MKLKLASAAAVAALCFAAIPAAAANDLWFHVTVQESKGNNENVTVNLPISLIETALTMIPAEKMQNGNIVIDSQEFDAAKLRQLWQEVKGAPDMTYVTVQSNDETIKVAKDRGYLIARTTDRGGKGADVNARIPLAVVDALLSGESNTLNLKAAVAALVDEGAGELVTVSDNSSHVRVWIDSNPEAETR